MVRNGGHEEGVRLSKHPDNRYKGHCYVSIKVVWYPAEYLGMFESEYVAVMSGRNALLE
jgi:hypothetical protein